MRGWQSWLAAAAGVAAVILAARQHAWPLGHWSQDLSPVPLLAGVALLSTALDRVPGLSGGRSGLSLPMAESPRWHLLGLALAAGGLALLGRSGLALALAAATVAAVATTGTFRARAVAH